MKKIPVLFLLLLLLFSCTIERKEEEKKEKLERPDMILYDGSFRMSLSGQNPILFTSSLLTYYSIDEYAEMEDLSFHQKGDDGEIRLQGRSEKAEIDTSRKILVLEGETVLEEMESGLRIETEGSLTYDMENDKVYTDDEVMVEYDKGTFQGTGFFADLRREEYSFTSIEKGNFNI